MYSSFWYSIIIMRFTFQSLLFSSMQIEIMQYSTLCNIEKFSFNFLILNSQFELAIKRLKVKNWNKFSTNCSAVKIVRARFPPPPPFAPF